jgi:hypothetical protein
MADQERSQGRTPAQPSRAEGERETVEQSLQQHGQGGGGADRPPGADAATDRTEGGPDDLRAKPSQAEGERGTGGQ